MYFINIDKNKTTRTQNSCTPAIRILEDTFCLTGPLGPKGQRGQDGARGQKGERGDQSTPSGRLKGWYEKTGMRAKPFVC